jgi:hypothetical protein
MVGFASRGSRTVSQDETAKKRMLEAMAADEEFAPYRLLLLHGEWFEPRVRPSEIPAGEKHFCFRNAFRLASERPGLRYIEGFGVSVGFEGMPERHAWCADSQGRVFDPTPTWADPHRPLTVLALRGISLPLDFVRPYVDHDHLHRGTLHHLTNEIKVVTDQLGLPRLP